MRSEFNVFDQAFNRLLELGIQSQTELASILGISSASVWNAKNENRFPKKWVSILCRIYDISPERLLGNKPQDGGPDLSLQLAEKKIKTLTKRINILEEKLDIGGVGTDQSYSDQMANKGYAP